MDDKANIQEYINNFRRHISTFLKPGIGLACTVYPVRDEGAVIEIHIGPNIKNEDSFKSTESTVNDILKVIPQRIVGGNLDAIKFSGTNISMEPNRILIIKGENEHDLWSDKGAKNDVAKIIGDHARVRE